MDFDAAAKCDARDVDAVNNLTRDLKFKDSSTDRGKFKVNAVKSRKVLWSSHSLSVNVISWLPQLVQSVKAARRRIYSDGIRTHSVQPSLLNGYIDSTRIKSKRYQILKEAQKCFTKLPDPKAWANIHFNVDVFVFQAPSSRHKNTSDKKGILIHIGQWNFQKELERDLERSVVMIMKARMPLWLYIAIYARATKNEEREYHSCCLNSSSYTGARTHFIEWGMNV